jgi:hypothetical protein
MRRKRKTAEIVQVKVSDNMYVDGKECTNCGKIKPLYDYQSRKTGLGGKHAECRECARERHGSIKRQNRVKLICINDKVVQAKECAQCKTIKEISDFSKNADNECAECFTKRKNEEARNRGCVFELKNNEETVKVKKCSKCHKIKKIEEFYNNKQSKNGVTPKCKACDKTKVNNFVRENPLIISKIAREQYVKNRENRLRYSSVYQKANPDKVRASSLRRYARKKSLPDTLSDEELNSLMNTFDDACALSLDEDVHFDHFIALSTGHGGTYLGNIIPLSARLNISKQDRNPFEWIKMRDDIDLNRFNQVVQYLSELNGLTTFEYEEFVYWCYENTRTVEEFEKDNRESIQIWLDTKNNV